VRLESKSALPQKHLPLSSSFSRAFSFPLTVQFASIFGFREKDRGLPSVTWESSALEVETIWFRRSLASLPYTIIYSSATAPTEGHPELKSYYTAPPRVFSKFFLFRFPSGYCFCNKSKTRRNEQSDGALLNRLSRRSTPSLFSSPLPHPPHRPLSAHFLPGKRELIRVKERRSEDSFCSCCGLRHLFVPKNSPECFIPPNSKRFISSFVVTSDVEGPRATSSGRRANPSRGTHRWHFTFLFSTFSSLSSALPFFPWVWEASG